LYAPSWFAVSAKAGVSQSSSWLISLKGGRLQAGSTSPLFSLSERVSGIQSQDAFRPSTTRREIVESATPQLAADLAAAGCAHSVQSFRTPTPGPPLAITISTTTFLFVSLLLSVLTLAKSLISDQIIPCVPSKNIDRVVQVHSQKKNTE